MPTHTANGDPRLSLWLRVREFAVPPSMIETATTRRLAGDWAGACAAAGIDVDFDLRSVARAHGRDLAARLRADLRHLAADLLRWHMPRIAPDGLLRPGLTLTLARYHPAGGDGAGPVHLVARTVPAWADAGQRISLALWDGSRDDAGARRHPHPRPNPRYRLDLHRHLWDARRTGELRIRHAADPPPGGAIPATDPDVLRLVPRGHRCAVERWAAEAAILLQAEGRSGGSGPATGTGTGTRTFTVRIGSRHRLDLDLVEDRDGIGPPALRVPAASTDAGTGPPPVLPDAATWALPDLELLRAGVVGPDGLHPLVASALVPAHTPAGPSRIPDRAGRPDLVECRGARHRIGLVDGVLVPLDHDPAEIRREELLAALTGTPLPCLQAIDAAHRRPDCLTGVRERLDHGDTAGALAVVESLLGPSALLRDGALRDELEAAAQQRITYGLFRAGLIGPGPDRLLQGARRPRLHRSHPRHTVAR
ncbi:hypothetical protein [Streptomyces sp. NPDC097981]|uniref:hypothetical protein n=1 Tax=Streptomyces sp. NPDC097981 TaxID=3155428 RepID=UPI00332A2AFC